MATEVQHSFCSHLYLSCIALLWSCNYPPLALPTM